MMTDIQLWIKDCEGLRLFPYTDTTGHLTIGYGHNLSQGITQEMAEFIFQCDYKQVTIDLGHFNWYIKQPQNVKNALINMCFNMGLSKLLRFKDMISALEKGDRTAASIAALDSVWAKQVPNRAKDVAVMMRED
jgi:lysozyme